MNDLLAERYKKQNEAPLDAASSHKKPKKMVAPSVAPRVPDVRFSDFGGIELIIQVVERPFKHPEIFRALGIDPPKGILLHGPPGCGKSKLAEAIAGEMGLPLIVIASPEIVSGMSGESEAKLREVFQSAQELAPCLVLFEEIDAITPKRENIQKEMEKRIVAQLLSCIDGLNKDFQEGRSIVMVLATTNFPDSIDPSLRRAGRFDREIRVGIPNEKARAEILRILSRKLQIAPDFDFGSIARLCPGYVGADLNSLVREAANVAVDRILYDVQEFPPDATDFLRNVQLAADDFHRALKSVQPSAKREGFVTVADVSWSDIGALDEIRDELRMSVVEPIRNRLLFESFGLTTASGVLLWGPPGCGKTLLAKAVANESHSNFISVKGPELINKYVGESEKAIRQVFDRARLSAPCIIFFDELDSLCPRRSESNENSSSRVVNQLLTEMDGIEERRDVYVIAATNRPDMIDPAMTRPGRLDKILYVPLPNEVERAEILKKVSKNTPWHSSVSIGAIARDPSGADLSSLVRESTLMAIKSVIEAPFAGGAPSVGADHVDQAFAKVAPSVSLEELSRYEYLRASVFSRR